MQIKRIEGLAVGKGKINYFHRLRSLYAQTIVVFVVQCQFIFALLVNFCLGVFLCMQYLFVEKKMVLMTSFTFLLLTLVSNLTVAPFSFPSQQPALFKSLIAYCFLVAIFEDLLSASLIGLRFFEFPLLYVVKIKQLLQI